jgi:crotonobetainyl-CoA:carnitine CoA-transferase CaiB-like acyl-CoA transferase
MAGDRRPPSSGSRVLGFSHILAGPYCARLLADLSANNNLGEAARGKAQVALPA